MVLPSLTWDSIGLNHLGEDDIYGVFVGDILFGRKRNMSTFKYLLLYQECCHFVDEFFIEITTKLTYYKVL